MKTTISNAKIGKTAMNSRMALPFCFVWLLTSCAPHSSIDKTSLHHDVKLESRKETREINFTKLIQDKLYLKVIELTEKSEDLNSLNFRAIALDLLGEHEKAQKIYLKLLEIYPKKTSILNNLALSYFLNGDTDKAKEIQKSCPKCKKLPTPAQSQKKIST